MEKRQEFEEGSEAVVHLDSLRATIYSKTPGHDGIRGVWFLKHSRPSMIDFANIPEWKTKK